MAKIIKVASTTSTPKIANLSKTTRTSTTNPFKYQNFEGNTLQFADVFEGYNTSFKGAEVGKMKMIAASVAGCMNKIKTGFEPIVNFVNRVRGGISDAWTYAKNTNISDLAAVKTLYKVMNTPIEIKLLDGISDKMSDIKSGISSKIGGITSDITDIGKTVGEKWNTLISKINHKGISSDLSVGELEQLWKTEIAMAEGGNL